MLSNAGKTFCPIYQSRNIPVYCQTSPNKKKSPNLSNKHLSLLYLWEQENIRQLEGHIVEKNFIAFTYVLINRKPSEHLVKRNRKTYKNWNTSYIVFDKYNCLFNNKKQIMFFWLSQVSPNIHTCSRFLFLPPYQNSVEISSSIKLVLPYYLK